MCPREPAGGEPAAGEAAEVVQRLQRKLLSPDTPLPHKYRVLFALRALPHAQAGHALAQGGLATPASLPAVVTREAAAPWCCWVASDRSAGPLCAASARDRVLPGPAAGQQSHRRPGQALGRRLRAPDVRITAPPELVHLLLTEAFPSPCHCGCSPEPSLPQAVHIMLSVDNKGALPHRVRHEAGEALGAIGTPACQDHLLRFSRDPCAEVAETCQLALQRIAHFASTSGSSTAGSSPYLSVDPAPPAPRSTPADQLRTELLDSRLPIFERYRALFGLRDRGGPQALDALGTALRAPGMQDALLKHEVAYVLGQMQDPAAVAMLRCAGRSASQRSSCHPVRCRWKVSALAVQLGPGPLVCLPAVEGCCISDLDAAMRPLSCL